MMKHLLLLALFLSADIALGVNINGPLNGACLQNITSDPSSPCEGRLFWDSDDNLFRVYNGAAWRTLVDTTTALANPSTTGVVIDGTADENQLRVQGHSTQTNDILVVEKSDGTDLLQVTNVNGTKIRGTTTNDNAAAGYVGEYFENVRSTNTPAITSATTTSIDSGNVTFNDGNETGITLTAGDWDVSANAVCKSASSNVVTQFDIFVGTAKGNSTTGADTARCEQVQTITYAANAFVSGSIPNCRYSISATTTYYLKTVINWTTGSITCKGAITARRVR